MNRFKAPIWTAVATLALAAVVLAPPAEADILHLDDVIIQFSLCVGNDCVNGESFGFDTIRLKENNIRIKFQDTSTSASFPSNDWELTANDSSNGGLNHFSITDISGGRTPFRVEAGARNNALYVETDGDIGVGTNNPAVDLHIKTGNTPTMRLDQDGSSGFTAQTFDVAGNEANFFIRDVTNGSRLVFRIRPGARTDSIFIDPDGAVQLGTDTAGGVLGTNDLTLLVGPAPGAGTQPARIGFEGGAEDFALVADPGTSRLIFASTSNPSGLLVLDGVNGLTPGGLPGTALCVGTTGSLCQCGSCN